MFDIKKELQKVPHKPGVYIMHDKNDEIIYVGKAIDLRRRVGQYFDSSKKLAKVAAMVSHVEYFEYIIVNNECEALVLESNLIKKNSPKYNIVLRDDKQYPYIKITNENDIKNRTDLRDMELFTIDGDDAKDLDDAVSLKLLESGNYELGVHIADVSFYVKENTELDKEAYNRGTSVYLVDRVLPMLPHKLSNGICSLNGGVDRFAISCIMEINEKGDVVNYNVFPSVIKSKLRMTYKKVNDILERNIVDEQYKPFENTLRNMKRLSDILRENKRRRGYIDFEIPEVKIIVDEKGKPIELSKRVQGTGEKLIEDFMIVANETVATYINNMELPFIYRVHGEPSQEKLNSFLNFVSILGYKPVGKLKKSSPQSVQNLLNQLKDKPEFPIFSELLLRSMQKAVYSDTNIGHFGLGSECYTHFTSPIRRYPDTTVHRLLRTYIFEGHNFIVFGEYNFFIIFQPHFQILLGLFQRNLILIKVVWN